MYATSFIIGWEGQGEGGREYGRSDSGRLGRLRCAGWRLEEAEEARQECLGAHAVDALLLFLFFISFTVLGVGKNRLVVSVGENKVIRVRSEAG